MRLLNRELGKQGRRGDFLLFSPLVTVLGQLLTNIASVTFIDLHLPENAHYLNQSFANAGWPTPQGAVSWESIGDALGPFGNPVTKLNAFTWLEQHTIVLGLAWGALGNWNASTTVAHELLHTVFSLMDQGGTEYHEFMGTKLGIPAPADGNWSRALNKWIEKGCPK